MLLHSIVLVLVRQGSFVGGVAFYFLSLTAGYGLRLVKRKFFPKPLVFLGAILEPQKFFFFKDGEISFVHKHPQIARRLAICRFHKRIQRCWCYSCAVSVSMQRTFAAAAFEAETHLVLGIAIEDVPFY